jgi:hypothetical protein
MANPDWVPGVSGNPSGRPKDPTKALAKQYTEEALNRLVEIMRTGSERGAITAAQIIMERAYGKPTQPISGDEELPPLKLDGVIRLVRP